MICNSIFISSYVSSTDDTDGRLDKKQRPIMTYLMHLNWH